MLSRSPSSCRRQRSMRGSTNTVNGNPGAGPAGTRTPLVAIRSHHLGPRPHLGSAPHRRLLAPPRRRIMKFLNNQEYFIMRSPCPRSHLRDHWRGTCTAAVPWIYALISGSPACGRRLLGHRVCQTTAAAQARVELHARRRPPRLRSVGRTVASWWVFNDLACVRSGADRRGRDGPSGRGWDVLSAV